jgi:MoxR-like ATPase
MPVWPIFKGDRQPSEAISGLPEPPPWRRFGPSRPRGATFQASPDEIRLVNAALFLRRPLLVTGKPGTGKTSLAYAVAHELQLGGVLRWSITSRSTLSEGLYRYDAIGRMQDSQLRPKEVPDIGRYLKLGPLGSALAPAKQQRVLLVDELDKSDIDLPNDLLDIFEEGEYEIPELARLERREVPVRLHESDEEITIENGKVPCTAFPFVVITSNGEREFSPPFLRRCLRLDMQPPDAEKLTRIVTSHLGEKMARESQPLIAEFLNRRTSGDIATDQLLNAIFLLMNKNVETGKDEIESLKNSLLRTLGNTQMS